jgi:hypothetical protein
VDPTFCLSFRLWRALYYQSMHMHACSACIVYAYISTSTLGTICMYACNATVAYLVLSYHSSGALSFGTMHACNFDNQCITHLLLIY